MTITTEDLNGKIISYYDSFSNTHDGFTIQGIHYNADRDGYTIRGSQAKDLFFLKSAEFDILLTEGKSIRYGNIDGCSFREIFTITG